MLTKQHYKAIAEIIKDELEYCKVFSSQAFAINICIECAEKLATYFATDNPRFDRDKFLAACWL